MVILLMWEPIRGEEVASDSKISAEHGSADLGVLWTPSSVGFDQDSAILRHQMVNRFDMTHSHPDDPGRHMGMGQPLIGTSWRNRPFHADLFGGAIVLNDISDSEQQSGGFFDGIRLGYDFDHYWGAEARFGFAEGRVTYPSDETESGKSQVILFDYSMLFYPWGDTKFRPYTNIGLGAAIVQYDDVLDVVRDESMVSIPLGIGFKHLLHRRFALRLEVLDNIMFGGSNVTPSHNFSVTGSVEYRFGAKRTSYTP